jgi:hypothetical protein
MRVRRAGEMLILMMVVYSSWACGGEARLVVDPGWPQRPENVAWGSMPGITVDAQDRICLFTRVQPAVQVYGVDGKLLQSWPLDAANAKGSHGIRVEGAGNFWLTDFRRHVVEKYSPAGKLLLRLGEPGHAGDDAGHFDGPTDTAILPSGDLFVSDGYGNRRVAHFDKQGKFVKQWGENGDRPGQFALPHAIVADSQQRLYVADRNNGRIQVFDTEGKLLAVWDNLLMPWGLAITPRDEIWVCGSSRVRNPKAEGWMVAPPPDQLLMKFNRDGKVLLRVPLPKIAVAPGKPGEVDWVHAVAVDSQGNIYLGDIQGKRAQKYLVREP